MSADHREKIRVAAVQRYEGVRRRDLEETPGVGVYATHEYREARQRLVEGKPCINCGSLENVHAHHVVPGDDETLVPLCLRCHPQIHAAPGAKGQ